MSAELVGLVQLVLQSVPSSLVSRIHWHEYLSQSQCQNCSSAHQGMNAALSMAFRGGAVTGLLVVGLGLLSIAGYYLILHLQAFLLMTVCMH